ncbi:AzlC family ABC transporter permease [Nocardioides sp.]|uniref:AzlC family ABC transporter permease n=1 Tax=Nocardioides sp. TaxID=35761 RepID=UPI003568457A
MTAPAPERRGSIIRDGLGVGIATGLYGTSFGAVSVGAGLSVAQTCALSLLVFTGASQFALISVLAAGGSAFAAAATAMLLGTRNALYGLRVAPLLGLSGAARFGAAHLLIDESTAMSVTRKTQPDARLGFFVTGGAVFVLWNLFTLLGALAGTALGDPETYGLDAAVGAAFLALLWPHLREPGFRVVAVVAVAVALGVIPIAPAGVPVLAGFAVALVAGLLGRGQR